MRPAKKQREFKKRNKRLEFRQMKEAAKPKPSPVRRGALTAAERVELRQYETTVFGPKRTSEDSEFRTSVGNVLFLLQPLVAIGIWVFIVGSLIYIVYYWFTHHI